MPSPAAPAPAAPTAFASRTTPAVHAAAPARGSHHAGFTLIELLVALSILAMLSLLGYRAVVSLTDAEVRLTAETAHWRALDTLFMRLEADLRQAQPRGVRGAAGVEPAWVVVPDRDGSAELRFSRAGPEFALEPASAGQRIGYRLRDGSVEVLYWPSLDVAPASEPSAYALVEGVRRLAIAALDSTGTWRDQWPITGEPPVPRAVRVELTLDGGETVERWLVLR